MERRFDVIIFGASGYTGKYAIREAIGILKNHKWAIAGRNMEKLVKTLREVEIFMDADLSNIPIIIADINDESSLREMTAQARVVVNCCGPYRFYGEAMVKACIETATSHVDVSGEPQYMETMQLKYNDEAREKGVYIVSACGFDSIPADMGTVFVQEKFNGTVNSVELYLRAYFLNDYEPSGAGVHYATFESAVYGFIHANEVKDVRQRLFRTRMPRLGPKLEEQPRLHRAKDAHGRWCLTIPSADHSVIMRSQRHFYENEKQRPIQLKSYNTYDSLTNAIKTVLAGVMLKKLTEYAYGREILLKYPKIFSFGFASHEGPDEMRNASTNFETLIVAHGWREKFNDPNEEIGIPMNKKMVARVVCNNPLYGAASKAVLLAATTILDESHSMPFSGGVFSPGAAFKHTRLIRKLQDNGIVFEILKTEELKAKL